MFLMCRMTNYIGKESKKLKEEKNLGDYTKVVVETDEENPTTIAIITNNDVKLSDGYRVRLTPEYN